MRLWVGKPALPTSWQTDWDKRQQVRGSALVSAEEWTEWFEWHAPNVETSAGWLVLLVRCIRDYQMLFVHFARRLRKNANWAGTGGEEEWMGCSNIANEKLHWFLNNRPADVKLAMQGVETAGIPNWAAFLFNALEGGFRTMARLGQEIDAVQRTGFKLVNVSADDPVDVDNDPLARESRDG